MTEHPQAAEKYRRTILGLTWSYDPPARRLHRWGVSDDCRGVGGQSDPISAYIALRRWRKIPARPM